MGLEGTEKIGATPLGENGECLDTCFRLSAYMQQNPIGNECTVKRSHRRFKPDDPVDLLTRNIHIPIDQRALQPLLNFRFRASRTHSIPSFWRTKLGITEKDIRGVAKTASHSSPKRKMRCNIITEKANIQTLSSMVFSSNHASKKSAKSPSSKSISRCVKIGRGGRRRHCASGIAR